MMTEKKWLPPKGKLGAKWQAALFYRAQRDNISTERKQRWKTIIFHVCSQKRCFSMQLLSCPVWISASLIALRYVVWREKHTRNAFTVVIPEEKMSQTPILPCEMLSWQQLGSSGWEQFDATACWLPEESGSGCRMSHWASVTLGRSLYSCTKQSRSLQNHTPTKKNGQQKGCLQCVAFFSQIFPFWR